MKAEVIAVSNSLLTGQARDENIQYLNREFSTLGINITRSHFVADQEDVLKEAIEEVEKRADVIVLVGGLGPDENDITKQTVSKHVDIPLVLDRESEDKIITYHKNSDFEMPDNNQLQALVIQDSIPIQNATGLAAGTYFEHGETTYILLPGPFDELKPTYEEEVRSLIVENLLEGAYFETRILRLFGMSEASIYEKIGEHLNYEETPFVGVYSVGEEFEIQITVKDTNKERAEKEADKIKKELLARVNDYVFAEESKNMLDTVKDLLIEEELTVTAAESLSGGELLSALSSEIEASKVFSGGLVTYSTEAKNDVLGVPKEVTDEFGVVSAQCAIEMAERSRDMYKTDISVSLTGVAGPSSLEGEIPGTVWIGFAKEGMESFAKQFHFAYKRNKNRRLSVLSAIDLIRRVVLGEDIEGKVTMDTANHEEESGEELQ